MFFHGITLMEWMVRKFCLRYRGDLRENDKEDMKLILIPFKKFCKTSAEVIELMQTIFSDMKSKKKLNDFSTLSKSEGGNVFDSIILQPNIAGIGVDIKQLVKSFFKKKI